MTEKSITKASLLLNSILFLSVGITIIFFNTSYLNIFHLTTSLLIIGLGGITLILNIIKTKKIKDILLSFSTLIIGIFIYNNKTEFLSLFPIIFGIYMLLNGTIKFITYIIFKNREKLNYYTVLLGSLIDFIFSYIMITHPAKNIKSLTIILGIYLILFAITYFKDFLKECFPRKNKKRRGLRITIPIIFSVLIPYTVFQKINKLLENWKTPVKIKDKKTSGNIDLEILIHVHDSAIGKVGHADLCFEGTVYSYGCYDEESKKLFESIGEGTLFETKEKEKYIKFCNNHSDKTIFCFGLSLTEEEKEAVKKELSIIKSYTYPWKNIKITEKDKKKNNYALNLIKETNAKFYKFNNSSYKTYFLLSTNCVKLVDDIVGATGSDLLKINGVITPGSYYAFLEKEFKRKNSNVISKQIYTNKKEKQL